MLINPKFPIIFESIKGVCKIEINSTSSYNMAEIDAVVIYVRKILKSEKWNNRPVCCSDIGVISPYRSQCNRIRAACDKEGFEGVTVGSAEVFQGQEKPIIIISTVRTTDGTFGFVKNKRVSQISIILST